MAGTKRGRHSINLVGNDEFEMSINCFKNIYDVLDDHPGTTLISLYWGDGGTGTDELGGANPFGPQAFAVFRFDTNANRTWPFYVFIMCNGEASTLDGGVFMNGSANSSGSGVVVMSAAVGVGGDENPWQGTTDADGADTKPTQYWDNPSAGTNVQVIPASNRTGGTDGTNKNNCMSIMNMSTPAGGLTMMIACDDDNLLVCTHEGDLSGQDVTYVGMFTPSGGHTSYPAPLMGFWDNSGFNSDTTFTEDVSGACHPDQTEATFEAVQVNLSTYSAVTDTETQPNRMTGKWDLLPLFVKSESTGHVGMLGRIDFFPCIMGPGRLLLGSDKNYLSWGASNFNVQLSPAVPWDESSDVRFYLPLGVDWTVA